MTLKAAGAVLILFSAGGMGFGAARSFRERLTGLKTLRRMIYCLRGEISYSRAPLKEALERVGEKNGTNASLEALFLQASARIDDGSGDMFEKIWEKLVDELGREKEKNGFLDEDVEALRGLGTCLGYLDVKTQERNLSLYLEELDFSIDYLRSHSREQCRLYASLGVSGGLFLVIAML